MDLAKCFDHTNLSPLASRDDIRSLCREAEDYGFFSVCVQPPYVAFAKEILGTGGVKVAAVVGFPQGQNTAKTKAYEARECLANGADEIDMVINYGALKDSRQEEVLEEILLVKEACGDKVLKVIFETSQLSNEEIIRACEISNEAGADFVKSSTGFLGEGATVENIRLMKKHSKGLVKASGGIRSLATSLAMIEAGASRLGSSSSCKIIEELRNESL